MGGSSNSRSAGDSGEAREAGAWIMMGSHDVTQVKEMKLVGFTFDAKLTY